MTKDYDIITHRRTDDDFDRFRLRRRKEDYCIRSALWMYDIIAGTFSKEQVINEYHIPSYEKDWGLVEKSLPEAWEA